MLNEVLMLLLNVIYQTKQGQRETFLSAIEALGIPEASRAEKGCLAYDYYYPVQGENTIFLNEIWENADCQAAHTRAAHFAKLQELKKEYVESVTLMKYNAERL